MSGPPQDGHRGRRRVPADDAQLALPIDSGTESRAVVARAPARAELHPDVQETVSIIVEILLAQRRRALRGNDVELVGHAAADMVKSNGHKEGRARLHRTRPESQP